MLRKLDDWKIGTKLWLLVGTLALTTAVVAGVAFVGLGRIAADAEEVGVVRLPSVDGLLAIKAGANQYKAAQRTLLDLGLEPEFHQRQYQTMMAALKECEAGWNLYEPLPQTVEEAELWRQFVAQWKQWQADNDAFLALSRRLDALDLGDPHELLSSVEGFRGDHYRLKMQVLEFLHHGVPLTAGDDDRACRFGKWLTSFKMTNPQLQRMVREVEAPHHALHQEIGHVKRLVAEGKPTEAIALFRKEVGPNLDRSMAAVEEVLRQVKAAVELSDQCEKQAVVVCRASQSKAEDLLDRIIDLNEQIGADAVASGTSTARLAETILAVVAAAGLAFGVVSGLVIARNISRPLVIATAYLEEVGRGELTREVPEIYLRRKDEIGAIARGVAFMVDSMRRLVRNMAGESQSLSTASTQLNATSAELTKGAEQTTRHSGQVAAAAQQMSANMTTIAASTEQMSANVKTVASAIEEMTASISEVARSADRAAEIAGRAAELATSSNSQICELGSAADQIGKVIEVIQDIAEQTNLLALNATIEAARAGEAGKGFAVVATEVKELARQTSSATEDIRKRIEAIQGSTGQAVHSIGDIGDVIKQVDELSRMIASAVEEQSTTTREIAKNVSESSGVAQTVARGVAETAAASREIAETIAVVDHAAKEAARGAAQTQTAGHDLSRMAGQFQSLVGQFHV
jgi:methyl-accepting chemotaxis protein